MDRTDLLLDGATKRDECFGNSLVSVFQNTLQLSRMRLVVFSEKGLRFPFATCSACSTNAMDVVFDRQTASSSAASA